MTFKHYNYVTETLPVPTISTPYVLDSSLTYDLNIKSSR